MGLIWRVGGIDLGGRFVCSDLSRGVLVLSWDTWDVVFGCMNGVRDEQMPGYTVPAVSHRGMMLTKSLSGNAQVQCQLDLGSVEATCK